VDHRGSLQLGAEDQALMVIAMLSDEANPSCPGSIAVHEDGAMGCAVCGSVAANYHGPDQVARCDDLVLLDLPGPVRCRRCPTV
jgi:hypothetical protein